MEETEKSSECHLCRRLFNPFYYVAGGKALALGILVILATGAVAALGGVRFDGVLDMHFGALPVPMWVSLAEGIMAWLLLAVILLAGGKLISKSRIRALDVFGTQALARFPYLAASFAGLFPGVHRFARHLVPGAQEQALPGDLAVFIIATVVSIFMAVWMVALMYRAFAVSCNVSGGRAAAVFIAALLVAETASKFLLAWLL